MNAKLKVLSGIVATVLSLSACGAAGNAGGEGQTETQSASGLSESSSTAEQSASTGASTAAATESAPTTGIAADLSSQDLEVGYDINSATSISLSGSGAEISGAGAALEGSVLSITAAGTYVFSGSASGLQIEVAAGDKDDVALIFNGVELSAAQSPLKISSAGHVRLTLVDGTVNSLSDEGSGGTELAATLSSDPDLVINGGGTLRISAKQKEGISGKDAVKIIGATLEITSVDNAIEANDALMLINATVDAESGNDAFHAENSDDATLGDIYIEGGRYTISAVDDGMHAGGDLHIVSGDINITQAEEGLEGLTVRIDDGNIVMVTSDDGINATRSDTDASNQVGQALSGVSIVINGGTIEITAGGDGIDSNGDVEINGGDVRVSSVAAAAEGALDYDGSGSISAGTLVAMDNGSMSLGLQSASGQASVAVTLNGQASAGSSYALKDASGNTLVSGTASGAYRFILISSADLQEGESYTLVTELGETTVTASTQVQGGFGGPGGGMPAQGGAPQRP